MTGRESPPRNYPVVLNLLVIAVTVVFVALILVVGRDRGEFQPLVEVGDTAQQDYIATAFVRVVDEDATELRRRSARDSVQTLYTRDGLASTSAKNTVREFFQAIREAAYVPVEDLPPTTLPPTTAPPTTIPETTDSPTSTPPDGTETTGLSDSTAPPTDGDSTETTVPVETTAEPTTEPPTTTTAAPTTTTAPPRRPIPLQESLVAADFVILESVIPEFVEFYNMDLDGVEAGEDSLLASVESQMLDIVDIQLAPGIRDTELDSRQNELVQNPPDLFVPGFTGRDLDEFQTAAAFVVAQALRANEHPDLAATEEAREAAAEAVEDVTVEYLESEPIVLEGQRIGTVQYAALAADDQLGTDEESDPQLAVASLGALAVLLAAFFLWRVAPGEWSQPKHFTLLGLLLVLAALASRLPEILSEVNPQIAFVLPAIFFGYVAAILYDPRTAVLMAVPLLMFTAVATGDAGIAMYAGAGAVVPVAFVSSVSSRRELRVGVMSSVLLLAPLAASIAWLFGDVDDAIERSLTAAGFAVVGGVVAGLLATGLLPFLESRFRLTTTLTLLDLVDRNHPALRLIEEKAPGTFNHSILVGTLAGKAARAIDADPLLAQAAAFYHDLGKTEHPQFYIENQFGVSNPHDDLPPVESAQIIRGHVLDGLRLARQYRIPDTVADGIRMHHGTGLMRYFYHKALEDDPAVDPDRYRHEGRKPRGKEMAILMICDACEGAARAMAQQEDPSADSIKKLVESVVGEKLEDGQLDESDLTYGELTRVKHAIVQALIGYYHTRIPYPGFPGPKVEAV